MNLTGLILSGGQSKRAGTDKGLKLINESVWVKNMADKLTEIGLPTKVSIHPNQFDEYRRYIDENALIKDCLDIPGPLKGILSAHVMYPQHNWLVVACDMIDLEINTMENIINLSATYPDFDLYCYENATFYQPFCAIYTAKALCNYLSAFKNNGVNDFSLQHFFKSYQTFEIVIDKQDNSFNNYNF